MASAYSIHSVEALSVRVNLALLKLDRTCYQLKIMQEEMSLFLRDYFARVQDHLPLREAQHVQESDTAEEALEEGREELKAECKRLYRQLARHYHPDISGQNNGAMEMINEAYRKRELGTLIRFTSDSFVQEIAPTDVETRGALQARLLELQRLTLLANDSIDALRASPEYQLQQRFRHAGATPRGIDQIAAAISQSLAHRMKTA